MATSNHNNATNYDVPAFLTQGDANPNFDKSIKKVLLLGSGALKIGEAG